VHIVLLPKWTRNHWKNIISLTLSTLYVKWNGSLWVGPRWSVQLSRAAAASGAVSRKVGENKSYSRRRWSSCATNWTSWICWSRSTSQRSYWRACFRVSNSYLLPFRGVWLSRRLTRVAQVTTTSTWSTTRILTRRIHGTDFSYFRRQTSYFSSLWLRGLSSKNWTTGWSGACIIWRRRRARTWSRERP